MVRHRDTAVTEERGRAPVFTVPLANLDGLREGENAHFEARLTPTDDPNLKVRKVKKVNLKYFSLFWKDFIFINYKKKKSLCNFIF